jgi:hypothetical protein
MVVGELGSAAASDAAAGKLLSGCILPRVTAVSTQLLTDTHSSILQAALVRDGVYTLTWYARP